MEKIVESYATTIFMYRAILENIVPALFSLFIGPWSDKFGRKPVLLCTFSGTNLNRLILLILNGFHINCNINQFSGYFFVYLSNGVISYMSSYVPVSPWYYLLSFIPISLSGGTCALITVLFCYMTDLNSQRERAFV